MDRPWKRIHGLIRLGNSGSGKGELASLMQDFSEPLICLCVLSPIGVWDVCCKSEVI